MIMKKNFKLRRYTKRQILIHRIIIASVAAILLLIAIALITPHLMNKVNLSKPDVQASSENNTEEVKPAPSDTDIIPGSNICYCGEKYAVAAEDVQKIIKGQNIDNNKYVFLTFDDGPSSNTQKVLDILKEKDAKATFFVLGQGLETKDSTQSILKRCISEGNAIGNHTYSHDPKTIYPNNSVNTDKYMEEFNKTNDLLKSLLGSDFDSRITRMPGGYNSRQYYKDKNLPVFDETLKNNGIISIDWNSMNGDAEGKNYSTEQLLNNAIKYSNGLNQVVILMHDTSAKDKTVEMLPGLIDHFKSNGYEFKTIRSTYVKDNNSTSVNN